MSPGAISDMSNNIPVTTTPINNSGGTFEDADVYQLFSLSNRTSIVTGGARGLGLVLAGALIEAGSHVYCLDILPDPAAKEWAALTVKAKAAGLTVGYRAVDITKPELVRLVFDEIAVVAPAPVRVFVAAAGIQQECPAIDYQPEDMRHMMDVNVVGTFITAQAAARIMLTHERGGSIILIASMSGSIANRGLYCTAYNSSKAAVQQMCRSVSAEWAGQGIRVNTISPGYIKTEMTKMLLAKKPELEERWADDNPLGRVSAPWEYKGPTVFLASDASSFCTGIDLRVDGGHCAW